MLNTLLYSKPKHDFQVYLIFLAVGSHGINILHWKNIDARGRSSMRLYSVVLHIERLPIVK